MCYNGTLNNFASFPVKEILRSRRRRNSFQTCLSFPVAESKGLTHLLLQSFVAYFHIRVHTAHVRVSCPFGQRPSVSAELFSILACHICLFQICHDVRDSLPVVVLSICVLACVCVRARARIIARTRSEDGNANDRLNHPEENIVSTIKMLFWCTPNRAYAI